MLVCVSLSLSLYFSGLLGCPTPHKERPCLAGLEAHRDLCIAQRSIEAIRVADSIRLVIDLSTPMLMSNTHNHFLTVHTLDSSDKSAGLTGRCSESGPHKNSEVVGGVQDPAPR